MRNSKWITTLVASAFTLAAASGYAQGYKKEELSSEQKAEIRDRAERLKTERMKAESAPAPTAAPAKAGTPKKTSKAMKRGTTTGAPVVKTTGILPKL